MLHPLSDVFFHNAVRRQPFFPVKGNYFSLSTTITSEPARSAAAGGGAIARPPLCFGFERGHRRRSCGNVGISPGFGEISKGLVERGGSLLLAFHAFHSPGISTALTALDFHLSVGRFTLPRPAGSS